MSALLLESEYYVMDHAQYGNPTGAPIDKAPAAEVAFGEGK